jgi:hypothetical protein
MFRELVRGRDAIFSVITEAAFRESFGGFFHTLAERRLENGRLLLHFERRRDG